MITVLEVARRLGKDPETVRRWIRAGKIPSQKIGLQHMIELHDLPLPNKPALPPDWRQTATGEDMPNPVAAVQYARSNR